ncbi:uncharacterized protein [Dendrobates tinctorius]|uniref:uncharacterized protein n=1 Tax=Dendrobates tinctorius TaxID=92724 RepID=UPI003CC9E0D3
MNINVMEQRAIIDYEQRTSTPKEQDINNRDSSVTCYKPITVCSEEPSINKGSDKDSSESSLISKELSEAEGTQQTKLSNRKISTVRRSMEVVHSRRGITNNNEHNENFTEKHSKDLGSELEKTESDDFPLEFNKEMNNGEDLTRTNLHVGTGVEKSSLVNKELSTFALDAFEAEKETTNQQIKCLNTQTLLTVMRKKVSKKETQHKAHKVCTEINKETLSQELRNENANTENIQEISSQEKKDQKVIRDSVVVQSEGSNRKPKKKVTFKDEIQHKMTYHKTRDQLKEMAPSPRDQTNEENQEAKTTPKKDATFSMCCQQINYPEQSTNDEIKSYKKEGQTGLIKQVLTNTKAYMTPTLLQKETFNENKFTLNNKEPAKDGDSPKLEIKNKHLICNKSDGNKYNETLQQTKVINEQTTCPVTKQRMNILMMDYKKPGAVLKANVSSTNAIIEHAKVNCTSLEDVRNVQRQSHRFVECLLAKEVETWEGETNTVVKITKEMATQMSYMIQYLDRKGPIKVK